MGGSIWGVLIDINATVHHKDPYTPSTFLKKIFPVIFHGDPMLNQREILEAEIEELEEEQESYDYGSYSYDVVDGELQYLYARLSRLTGSVLS